MGAILRKLSCWSCLHCGKQTGGVQGKPDKVYCDVTKRSGSLQRGYYCTKFEYRQLDKPIADDGIMIKNRQPLDYRTKSQWAEVGRTVRSDAEGTVMHPSRQSMKTYTYYLKEDTEPC